MYLWLSYLVQRLSNVAILVPLHVFSMFLPYVGCIVHWKSVVLFFWLWWKPVITKLDKAEYCLLRKVFNLAYIMNGWFSCAPSCSHVFRFVPFFVSYPPLLLNIVWTTPKWQDGFQVNLVCIHNQCVARLCPCSRVFHFGPFFVSFQFDPFFVTFPSSYAPGVITLYNTHPRLLDFEFR